MPEGDTIFRTAATLHRVLAGQRLRTSESIVPAVEAASFAGQVVAKVEAHGKNVLIVFEDGRVLLTHMRMKGSWHVYRFGERWLRRTAAARVVLTTEAFTVVCFSAPVARVLAAREVDRDPALATLGPDLLRPACDLAMARENLRREPDRELGDALMQQCHVAGIGNVYKSETLFVCHVDPFARVGDVDDPTLESVLAEARALLLRNVGTRGPRGTRNALAGNRRWVYMRAGEACLACRTAIEVRKQGAPPRSTYYCPSCQNVASASRGANYDRARGRSSP